MMAVAALATMLWLIEAIVICIGKKTSKSLPLCEQYADTRGQWVSKDHFLAHRDSLSQHFIHNNPGQALIFDYLWLPSNCSYHRFTNSTINEVASKQVEKYRLERRQFEITHSVRLLDLNQPLSIVFMGDSALRGIICAISRIYTGTENLGPCMNNICGMSKRHREVTIPFIHKRHDLQLGENLTISFFYVKHFLWRKLDQLVEHIIEYYQPHILVFHTASWEFYEYSKAHKNETAPVDCHDDETKRISEQRSNAFVNQTMWKLSNLAQQHYVRLIYRNSHYNKRYGALCADEKLEQLIAGSNWELWDNRGMSKEVWQNQTFDGFHFDWEPLTYSVEDHRVANVEFKKKFGQLPGMLGLQFAHSLLNAIFHEEVKQMQKDVSLS